ncbi:DNA topoisomerase I, partial [Geobacillus sp. MMMUD3]|nr:DNA topoisomerase I [Geobacillus sp. MMMUD3]
SQMADAKGKTATIRVAADLGDGHEAGFSASGTVITFRGFLAAYEEGTDASRYDTKSGESRLPQVEEGQALSVVSVEADGHTTAPPPRFTEASLVKQLEELGIGRPSTYASIISVIQDRGYVTSRGNALVPSWLAFSVVRLLEEHFTELVDYEFTADLESELDRIAMGEEDRKAWLARFYFGAEGYDREGLKEIVDDLGDIDAREVNTVPITDGVALRVGRYGPYLEVASAAEGEDPK